MAEARLGIFKTSQSPSLPLSDGKNLVFAYNAATRWVSTLCLYWPPSRLFNRALLQGKTIALALYCSRGLVLNGSKMQGSVSIHWKYSHGTTLGGYPLLSSSLDLN